MATAGTPPPQEEGVGALPPAPQQKDDTAALRAEIERRGREVEELKRRVMAPPAPAASGQPLDATQLKTEFFKNPLEMSAAIAQRAVMEAQARQGAANYDTLLAIAKSEARKGSEDVWDKFSNEIEMMVKASVDPQFHTNINVWKNALTQVKGQHIDEILEMRKQQVPAETSRGPALHISREGGPAQSSRSAPIPPKEKLSSEELDVARKLRITPEQYIEGKRFLEGQSEKGPSSWDKYITTDSREKRRQDRANRAAANVRK